MDLLPEPFFGNKVETGDVITSPQFVFDHGNGFVGGNVGSPNVVKSRAKAKFVVIEAIMDDQSSCVSTFPPGWRVCARRLNANDVDDGQGEVISFYQYLVGGTANYGVIKKVKVVGRMLQRFV